MRGGVGRLAGMPGYLAIIAGKDEFLVDRDARACYDKARAAAARILKALPPSAAEAAREAEQLTRVAAGEQMHEPEDVDVMLARALERAMRLAEKTVASTAEAAILLQCEDAPLPLQTSFPLCPSVQNALERFP